MFGSVEGCRDQRKVCSQNLHILAGNMRQNGAEMLLVGGACNLRKTTVLEAK